MRAANRSRRASEAAAASTSGPAAASIVCACSQTSGAGAAASWMFSPFASMDSIASTPVCFDRTSAAIDTSRTATVEFEAVVT